uniref:Uncharacterized protein n=1 Tax=Rhizophora mucronata TaxID=61149 RepID=A0A2P2NCT5_RHIMU
MFTAATKVSAFVFFPLSWGPFIYG